MQQIALYFFVSFIFIFVFGLCWFMLQVYPKLFTRTSTFFSGTRFSVYLFSSSTESSGEDDDASVAVERVTRGKTRDYEWHIVCNIAINSLAISGEICFLTTGPVVGFSMIFAELPERKNCGSFFKNHKRHEQVQFFDIHCRFFSCLHLAVGPSSPSSDFGLSY